MPSPLNLSTLLLSLSPSPFSPHTHTLQKTPKQQPQPLGLGAVLLDALAAREWVNEDGLADALGVHPKAARRALRVLEREQLVQREHRKETARRKKRDDVNGGGEGESDGDTAGTGGGGLKSEGGGAGEASKAGATAAFVDESGKPPRQHVHSYASIDWPRMFDVVRWRLGACRAALKERAAGADAVARYACPRCGATHDTLHAAS